MKKLITVALIVVASFSSQGAAQGPAPGQAPSSSISGVVRLNRLPISNEVLKVKLPRPVERKLSNGLKLLVVESHRIPSITLTIRIPTGDLRNPPELDWFVRRNRGAHPSRDHNSHLFADRRETR